MILARGVVIPSEKPEPIERVPKKFSKMLII